MNLFVLTALYIVYELYTSNTHNKTWWTIYGIYILTVYCTMKSTLIIVNGSFSKSTSLELTHLSNNDVTFFNVSIRNISRSMKKPKTRPHCREFNTAMYTPCLSAFLSHNDTAFHKWSVTTENSFTNYSTKLSRLQLHMPTNVLLECSCSQFVCSKHFEAQIISTGWTDCNKFQYTWPLENTFGDQAQILKLLCLIHMKSCLF